MTKCRLVPLNDYVVVRLEEAKDKTEGGILLPDTAKKKTCRGVVLAVGPGKPCEALAMVNKDNFQLRPAVEVGQTVVLAEYAGNPVEVDGETLVVTSESNILAVVRA